MSILIILGILLFIDMVGMMIWFVVSPTTFCQVVQQIADLLKNLLSKK